MREDSFASFSLHFMRFLLYRHLSNKKEDDLIDRLFTSPHKKELKDIAGNRPLVGGQLLKNYLREKADELANQILIPVSSTVWNYA